MWDGKWASWGGVVPADMSPLSSLADLDTALEAAADDYKPVLLDEPPAGLASLIEGYLMKQTLYTSQPDADAVSRYCMTQFQSLMTMIGLVSLRPGKFPDGSLPKVQGCSIVGVQFLQCFCYCLLQVLVCWSPISSCACRDVRNVYLNIMANKMTHHDHNPLDELTRSCLENMSAREPYMQICLACFLGV